MIQVVGLLWNPTERFIFKDLIIGLELIKFSHGENKYIISISEPVVLTLFIRLEKIFKRNFSLRLYIKYCTLFWYVKNSPLWKGPKQVIYVIISLLTNIGKKYVYFGYFIYKHKKSYTFPISSYWPFF